MMHQHHVEVWLVEPSVTETQINTVKRTFIILLQRLNQQTQNVRAHPTDQAEKRNAEHGAEAGDHR